VRVDLFDFDLPIERIAERPASPRDAARLLVVGNGRTDHVVRDLPTLLRAGDLLVVNDTKVIPARLTGRRGPAKIEVTLHMRRAPDRWVAFARPAKKLKPGDRIEIAPDFAIEVLEVRGGGEVVLGFPVGDGALLDALERHGSMPLPPYIRRAAGADARDRADYQTLFAREAGAVAAPTAGLHFTPGLDAALTDAGIARVALTLHVGAGTFLPVRAEDTDDHRMHQEIGRIAPETAERINATRRAGGRIVAVGTTACRLLESAAEADGTVRAFAGPTDLFILPGYRFKAVDLLMTNFHLPRSTLFMLVSAFAGLERMKAAYAHAIQSGYRFYSYGDACLLHPAPR
jgi:S-adenosylmethionine:tRNA ribosyltransferase-isomerase